MPRPSVETQRKEQILAATCQAISQIGFRSLRIADVAARAGTSTGTVHYYFESKQALTRAAFEWNFARSLERRRALLTLDADPVARLRAFLDSYLPQGEQTVEAWLVWAELWVEALHDDDLQQVNDTVYGEWRAVITEILRDAQSAGQLRGGDPALAANALIAMIDGLALQVLLRSHTMDVPTMRAVCQHAVDALLLPQA